MRWNLLAGVWWDRAGWWERVVCTDRQGSGEGVKVEIESTGKPLLEPAETGYSNWKNDYVNA